MSPIFFYVFSVLCLQGVLISALFLIAWQLSGSWMAGVATSAFFIANKFEHYMLLSLLQCMVKHSVLVGFWKPVSELTQRECQWRFPCASLSLFRFCGFKSQQSSSSSNHPLSRSSARQLILSRCSQIVCAFCIVWICIYRTVHVSFRVLFLLSCSYPRSCFHYAGSSTNLCCSSKLCRASLCKLFAWFLVRRYAPMHNIPVPEWLYVMMF